MPLNQITGSRLNAIVCGQKETLVRVGHRVDFGLSADRFESYWRPLPQSKALPQSKGETVDSFTPPFTQRVNPVVLGYRAEIAP